MSRQSLLPPIYFLASILLMALLRLLLPLAQWISWPWNLAGAAFILLGGIINLVADKQFKIHGTTVKPFQASSALITDGVLSRSRNPMYLGMVLILSGLGICLTNVTSLMVVLAFIWWVNIEFVLPEERHLTEQFGRTYAEYKTKVRRWL